MPIYAYKCSDCRYSKDILQKISDPLLTKCPSCGKDTFSKQLTAAGFQLKGSGWYVTDFRNNNRNVKSDNTQKEDENKGDKKNSVNATVETSNLQAKPSVSPPSAGSLQNSGATSKTPASVAKVVKSDASNQKSNSPL